MAAARSTAHSAKDSHLGHALTVDLRKVAHSSLHPFGHLLNGDAGERAVLTKTESGAPHLHLPQPLEYHKCLINKDVNIAFLCVPRVLSSVREKGEGGRKRGAERASERTDSR